MITQRLFGGPADLELMLALRDQTRPMAFTGEYPGKADIEEALADEAVRKSIRLWKEGCRLVAWAYVDCGANLCWELDAEYESALGEALVAWGESCVRSRCEECEALTLDASCREDDAGRLSFLASHGFRENGAVSLRMARSLTDAQALPPPVLPAGYYIRSAKGKEEAGAIAETHRAAFGTDYMTEENRLAVMMTSLYDPALDLLAIAPDGAIAGYCTCAAGTGTTDPVAVHPAHQRKGLAKALLVTGLSLLRTRGVRVARFTTDGLNIAMQKAGESAGFRAECKIIWFEKPVQDA